MRMKKFLTIGAAIALAFGFASCNKDKSNEPDVHGKDADTYVGVSISFPASSMRANLPDDYNKIGAWEGRDAIESIKVYVVTDDKTVNSTQFGTDQFNKINNGVLTPNLAVEAKSGQKVKAYVVINGNKSLIDKLDALDGANFATEFPKVVSMVTTVSEVAKFDGQNDVVVMTNEIAPTDFNIEAGATKEQAISGEKNQIKVNVSRVVARGIVTLNEAYTKEINIERTHTVVDNSNPDAPTTKTEKTTTAKVTITDVEYQVTGSALQFNALQDATTWKVPEAVYTFIPTGSWDEIKTRAAQIMTYTDESAWKAPIAKADNSLASIKEALAAEQFSKFALPVTHATDGGYKQGSRVIC